MTESQNDSAAERDPATQSCAEDLDEDRLHVDPLEEGMDPPEHWSQADRFGNTLAEQRQGEDLEHRLRAEEPDVQPQSPDDQGEPASDGREDLDDLDETIDDEPAEFEQLPDDTPPAGHEWAVRRGQSADEAGGSMAEIIRTPPDPAR